MTDTFDHMMAEIDKARGERPAPTKTAMHVLREWWMQVARMGMTPSEAAESLSLALHVAGYEIVRKTDL